MIEWVCNNVKSSEGGVKNAKLVSRSNKKNLRKKTF